MKYACPKLDQLSFFMNSLLQQIIDMQNTGQQSKDNMGNEEDENMEDQVVPELQIRVQSPPTQNPLA